MTDFERRLIIGLLTQKISKETFNNKFPVDIKNNLGYIQSEIRSALEIGNPEEINLSVELIWLSESPNKFLDLLNELLINPNHYQHQQIAKTLQAIKSPSTIPYVEKILQTNFNFLDYTGSESSAIAKWFSWLLFEIGTQEAIDLMRNYSTSTNEGIRNEMTYRLSKMDIQKR